MDDVTGRLRALIAAKLEADPAGIREDTDLVTELGADSLAIVELMMAVEEEMGIRVDEEAADRVRTFGDAVALVRSSAAA
ncbi:MAG: acyl carrier protein [bacterium]|nr:acyl carrier protein [bacterium]